MDIFYVLLVLLVVTRTFGVIAERLRQPALIGELIAGITLGAFAAQHKGMLPFMDGVADSDIFRAITDLGMFFLMLLAGVEMQPHKILKYSPGAFLVAVGGVLLPLALGFGLGWLFVPDGPLKVAQCFFIGTALAITAVPASVRVLMDLGKLNSKVGQVIVTAAVFDDVLSLLLLAWLTGMIGDNGGGSLADLWDLSVNIVSFFAITIVIGLFGFPKGAAIIQTIREKELEFSVILIVAFAFAVMAESFGLHFILGPFVAGMFIGRKIFHKHTYENVKSKLSGMTFGFLAPVFFASVGLNLELSAFWEAPLFLALMIVMAFAGKILGAGAAAKIMRFSDRDALAIGVGMSARGAVELVIADIALRAGLFGDGIAADPVVRNIFSAVVIMAIVTTIATSVGLRYIMVRTGSHATRPKAAPAKQNEPPL